MRKEIWFDMDGTIADLYGVENWLEMLMNEDATPYQIARPLVRMATLARMLNKLQRNGYQIGIVTWLSKNGTDEYNKKVTKAKKEWLKRHLKTVCFDKVDVLPYGTPKQVGRDGFLFDDEVQNRENWNGQAFDVNEIIEVLKVL